MAANAIISEADYLRTSFRDHDREFRDGEVVERGMPDWLHSLTQANLVAFFWTRQTKVHITVVPEFRQKVRPGRHVVPDVTLFWPAQPSDSKPDHCPYLTVEILSPDDRHSEVREKLAEYSDWGVAHIWLVDPHLKVLYVFRDGLHEVTSLALPELGIELRPEDIFS